MGQRLAEGDGAAQRVADQGAALDADDGEEGVQRGDEEVQAVLGVLGLVRATEAGQVEDDVAVAGGGEQRVVALEVAEAAGPRAAAVQPEHHRALALVEVVQAQAVGQGGEVAEGQRKVLCCHGLSPDQAVAEAEGAPAAASGSADWPSSWRR
ncbi:hypothetical protein D9M71_178800 [compost metagenome]